MFAQHVLSTRFSLQIWSRTQDIFSKESNNPKTFHLTWHIVYVSMNCLLRDLVDQMCFTNVQDDENTLSLRLVELGVRSGGPWQMFGW